MDLSQARLLFLSTGSGLGGSEKILAHLARAERPAWRGVGICSLKPLGSVGRLLEREGVPVFSCDLADGHGVQGLLATLRTCRPLLDVVGEFRPTLIHAFLFRAGLLARLPVCMGRVPRLVVSIRRLETRGLGAHLLDRWTSRAVHRFTAVSEAARRQIVRRSGIPAERIDRIPNGVVVPGPPEAWGPAAAWREERRAQARRRLESLTGPLPNLLIGSVGRLEKVKGHRVLLEAVARLVPTSSGRIPGGPGLDRVGVVLAGDGRERRALEAMAARPPLAGRVWFLGERADLPDLLPALDLFVLPSLSEGMSNALLEAMAEGIPAVATRVGGNPEVIVPGVCGVLVDPGDPAALGGAIAKLVASPERARALGLAGRERVRREFSFEEMLRAYHHLYWKLLSAL
jgi:glycosyltransferase involved in cell wall biosynthesis